jgi:hypothetical protein
MVLEIAAETPPIKRSLTKSILAIGNLVIEIIYKLKFISDNC